MMVSCVAGSSGPLLPEPGDVNALLPSTGFSASSAGDAAPPTSSAQAPGDVLIVGAGPAGLALAIALAQLGLRSTVLEQAPHHHIAQPAEDGRDIALTHCSRRILERLGIWQQLPAADIAPLRQAQVRNGHSPWVLPFDAQADGHDALGWLVPNQLIRAACYRVAASRPEIHLVSDARVTTLARDALGITVRLEDGSPWRAPLLVAADSRFSSLRRMAGIGARMLDFGRTAIVCRMHHEREHEGIAHECFLNGHTLAMLPMAGRQSSAVWTVNSAGANHLMALGEEAFAAEVAQAFEHRLGTMTLAAQRHAYPLVAVYAQRFCAERFALIGDAAVGMHPVTAHGYNFGLYGVETLQRELQAARQAGREVGDARALQAYAREHERATLPIYLGTNAIVKLFTNEQLPARWAREAVLRLASHLPPLKKAIARQLTGRINPALG